MNVPTILAEGPLDLSPENPWARSDFHPEIEPESVRRRQLAIEWEQIKQRRNAPPPPAPRTWEVECQRCHERVAMDLPPGLAPNHYGKVLCKRCAPHVEDVNKESKARPPAPPLRTPTIVPLPSPRRAPVLSSRLPEVDPPVAPEIPDLDSRALANVTDEDLAEAAEEVAAELEAEVEAEVEADVEPVDPVEPEPQPEKEPEPMPATATKKAPATAPSGPPNPKCTVCGKPRDFLYKSKLEGAHGMCRRCATAERVYGPGGAAKSIQPNCDECGGARAINKAGRMPPPGKCWTCAGRAAAHARHGITPATATMPKLAKKEPEAAKPEKPSLASAARDFRGTCADCGFTTTDAKAFGNHVAHAPARCSKKVEAPPAEIASPAPAPAPLQLPASPLTGFERIAAEIGKLVTEKNAAYGDSFTTAGKFLELLYPDGIKPAQYGDALALVRIFDKQKRIATRKDAFGESPYRDIAGYGVLGAAKDEAGVSKPAGATS